MSDYFADHELELFWELLESRKETLMLGDWHAVRDDIGDICLTQSKVIKLMKANDEN